MNAIKNEAKNVKGVDEFLKLIEQRRAKGQDPVFNIQSDFK